MLGSRVSRTRSEQSPRRSTPKRRAQATPSVHSKQNKAEKKSRLLALVPSPPAAAIVRAAAPSTRRPLLLLMVFIIVSGGLISRLVFWQVLQHARLAEEALAQHAAMVVQPTLRGRIFASDGTPLATDVTRDLLYAVPREISDPGQEALELAPILNLSVNTLDGILGNHANYAQLSPGVTAAQAQKIKQLGLAGIVLQPVIARSYPEGETAAQVLGYYGANGKGNYGLEQYYDSLLSGIAPLSTVLHGIPSSDVHPSTDTTSSSQNGADLYLSLDSFVQNAAETEIAKAVKVHSADSGSIIVMDPHTGRILGMASTPTYDPNQYARWGNDESRFLNPAVSWDYEPGSTFKIMTMAAGIDSGVITPNTAFEDTGVWRVGTTTLHNWNNLGNGWETMTQVLQHSANVGASFVSSRLGVTRFYAYLKRFGIGQPTGVDLSGEESGMLPLPGDKTWTIVNQFTNSFGQGLSTTPLQMMRAVAAVANGGVMMQPQLVTRIDYRGKVVDVPPVSQGRVISAQSAHTVTDMLVHSAIAGEAQYALIKGYNIAAKTGTANIADDGGYINGVAGATIASTIAWAPAFHPRFLALVILNRPHDQPWGSTTAAPVIHDLFQDLFMYYHIPPSPHALYR